MKRKTAKETLAESFRELAETKTVDIITVKEIAQNCGYSSATFYRHFHDKYDLIAWEHAQRVAAIMSKVGRDGYTWKQTLLDGARMFERERDYLANLLTHTSGHDAFICYMVEINYEALRRQIMISGGMESLDAPMEAVIRIYVLGTVSMSCEWILGNSSMSAEALAESFVESLPQMLHPYLL